VVLVQVEFLAILPFNSSLTDIPKSHAGRDGRVAFTKMPNLERQIVQRICRNMMTQQEATIKANDGKRNMVFRRKGNDNNVGNCVRQMRVNVMLKEGWHFLWKFHFVKRFTSKIKMIT